MSISIFGFTRFRVTFGAFQFTVIPINSSRLKTINVNNIYRVKKNRVHEFLAGDVRHPRTKNIYTMLRKISKWFKSHGGYTPLTESVLHQMDESEKERSLEVHSEKLAFSIGLISTQPGTTIRIVKNLRFCSNCHEVMKLAFR